MNTVEEFKNYVSQVQGESSYKNPLAFALGVKRTKNGKVLDAYFPLINWNSSFGTAAVLIKELGVKAGKNAAYNVSKVQLSNVFSCFKPFVSEIEKHHNVALMQTLIENCDNEHDYYSSELIAYFLYDDTQDVQDAVEGYFKLQAISQRHVLPHGLNLNGIFGKLNNIAWTDKGPILPEDLASQTTKYLFNSPLTVSHVDKFPYLVNYHLPSGKIHNSLSKDYFIIISGLIVRKEVFSKIGKFNPNFNIIGDFDFVMRASKVFSFHAFNLPLTFYRIHQNNYSKMNSEIFFKEFYQWYKNQKETNDQNFIENKNYYKEKLLSLEINFLLLNKKKSFYLLCKILKHRDFIQKLKFILGFFLPKKIIKIIKK